jgi:hypothetical protein
MLLILRTTCCEHEWSLSDVVSSNPAVSTQLQQEKKKDTPAMHSQNARHM